MAKQFILKLSPHDKTRKIYKNVCRECGNVIEEGLESISILEKSILIQLFNLAASTKKNIQLMRLCYDCINQVENLNSDELVLEFTEQDLGYLKEGFELTSGMSQNGVPIRPAVWRLAYDLFKQIESPVEKV